MKRVQALLIGAACLCLYGCSPSPRDILVVSRNGQLVIDFPWSIWRLIGRQDRSYCVRDLELFDEQRVLWKLEQSREQQCTDVRMAIPIGKNLSGFRSLGRPQLKPGVRYGVRIGGIGRGRVDFELAHERGVRPINETNWRKQIEHPEDRAWRERVEAMERAGLSDEEIYERLHGKRVAQPNSSTSAAPATPAANAVAQ